MIVMPATEEAEAERVQGQPRLHLKKKGFLKKDYIDSTAELS